MALRFNYYEFVHLLLLLGFCGGPLLVSDHLQPLIGKTLAVATVIVPFMCIVFGAFALRDEITSDWDEVALRLGISGALLILAANAYAIWFYARGGHHPSFGLNMVGIFVGTPAAIAYLFLVQRKLEQTHTHWPHDRPIE